MKLNDKKILASAYFDRALTSEESQWAEEQFAQDPEIKNYLKSCQEIHQLVHDYRSIPTLPHTLEYNWQKCRSSLRKRSSFWESIFGTTWIRGLSWAGLGFFICGLIVWQFNDPSTKGILTENSNIETIVIPVASLDETTVENPSIDRAWSPRPNISVTSFPAGKASVIWLSGMPYRSETNIIK